MALRLTDLIDDLILVVEKGDLGRVQLRLAKVKVAAEIVVGENEKLRTALDTVQKEHYQTLKKLNQVADLSQIETEFKEALRETVSKKKPKNGHR